MSEQKECLGRLANLTIRFRDHSKQHYMRIDEDKLKECEVCPLFNRCLFLKHNELFKEVLRLIDERLAPTARTRIG